jgi:hypothetical protein
LWYKDEEGVRAYMPGGSKTGQTNYYQLTGQSTGQNQGGRFFSGQTAATGQTSRDDFKRFVDMFTRPRSRGVLQEQRTTGQMSGQIDSQDRYMGGVYQVGGGVRAAVGASSSRGYMAGEGAAGGSSSRENMAGRGPLEGGIISRHYLAGEGAAGGGSSSRDYMAGEGGYFGGRANIESDWGREGMHACVVCVCVYMYIYIIIILSYVCMYVCM